MNILSEQKAAKIIDLLEELRRDLPGVVKRADEEADALSQSADPETLLAAIRDAHEAGTNDADLTIHPRHSNER